MDTSEHRFVISAPFLRGHGLEIGPGASPQRLPAGVVCEYFDKRTESELAELFGIDRSGLNGVLPIDKIGERFPEGADFLIAHHVLEHCSNPIRTLLEWQSYLKNGGILVVSVPDAKRCPDSGRLVPPIEHLVEDYILDRDDDSYESREHIYSFVMGWIDDGFAKDRDKFEIARITRECAKAKKNDLHWHAFNSDLLIRTIAASARVSGNQIVVKAFASPDLDHCQTELDVICVCKVSRGPDLLGPSIARAKEGFRVLISDIVKQSNLAIEGYPGADEIPEYEGRRKLAEQYIVGNGLEIGALHCPVPVPSATVRYVDILSEDEHRMRDGREGLVRVDIVDDGETLATIAEQSIDFIIANHFFEHCENPLGTLRTHLSKLRKGGVLFYSIPNKEYTFDRDRPLTTFEHVQQDDMRGPEVSRRDHYREWAMYVDKLTDPNEIEDKVKLLLEKHLRVHFHVWNRESLREFFNEASRYLENVFTLDAFVENYTEVIVILRKATSN